MRGIVNSHIDNIAVRKVANRTVSDCIVSDGVSQERITNPISKHLASQLLFVGFLLFGNLQSDLRS